MTTEIAEESLMQFRRRKIKDISNVLDECDKTIEDLSKRFEWDKKQLLAENLQESNKKAQCPFNIHHVMTLADLDNHIQKCRTKDFEPCKSSSNFYNSTSSVVSITTDVRNSSEGSDRDLAIPAEYHVYMYTPEERLCRYDEDIKITSSKRKAERDQFESEDLSESPLDSKETTSGNLKSELELLAEKRDYKRRRQSYRAKNVHITKRTPIEITREIINNRMEELQNFYEESKKALSRSKDKDEK